MSTGGGDAKTIISPNTSLRAAKNVLTINHMKTLYYSMIHPYLDYVSLLWGSASKTNI